MFMRKIAATAATAALGLTGASIVAPTAANATYGDYRACVTQREYNVAVRAYIWGNPGPARIRQIFDFPGRITWTDGPRGYYDETRDYRKCSGFDGGRGAVEVWYDDYTYSNWGELRVYEISRY